MSLISFPPVEDNLVSTELSPVNGVNLVLTNWKRLRNNFMQEFFHMGGYAFYVWSSYGLTALVLIANFISPWSCLKDARKTIQRQLRREEE